jgi:redox-sensitive bicupin YhaK (pirin superfamily)
VIAGAYQGVQGKAETYTPVHLLNVKLAEGDEADFEMPADYNTMALVIEGKVSTHDGQVAEESQFILFANDGEQFSLKAHANAKILILSGEPINEPIAAQGPFVMNTREELMMAFYDLQKGKFGVLED